MKKTLIILSILLVVLCICVACEHDKAVADTTVTFTIGTTSYTCAKGTTWEVYANQSASDPFTINGGLANYNGHIILKSGTGEHATAIIESTTYTVSLL